MRSRLETLQRLATLYAAVEEMHSTELQKMTTAVRDAQRAVSEEQEAAQSARASGRSALLTGDRVGWLMAETGQETAGLRRRGLEEILREREELNDAAREQYVASRLKREQMKRVFEEIAARSEIEEARRAQAASDDRFLTRRRWTDAQRNLREGEEMKVS